MATARGGARSRPPAVEVWAPRRTGWGVGMTEQFRGDGRRTGKASGRALLLNASADRVRPNGAATIPSGPPAEHRNFWRPSSRAGTTRPATKPPPETAG